MKYLVLASALLLAGCGDYPRDIAGTADRVQASRTFRVGVISGESDGARISAYLGKVASLSGAQPRIEQGSADPLLLRLKQGDLDLVIGELSKTTPWAKEVMVIEPIAERPLGEETVVLSPVARNGENRWIMLLEKAARDL